MVAGLTVGVLGSLEVGRDGVPLEVAAPKQRVLLAMLALDAQQVLSTDVLVDRLWEGHPPQSAVATVQVYVSQLRKLVGAGAIVTQPPGYRLAVAGESVDAMRFDGLVSRGRAHHLHAAAQVTRQSGSIDEELDRQACESLRAAGDRAMGLGGYTTAGRHYSSAMELATVQDDSRCACPYRGRLRPGRE